MKFKSREKLNPTNVIWTQAEARLHSFASGAEQEEYKQRAACSDAHAATSLFVFIGQGH